MSRESIWQEHVQVFQERIAAFDRVVGLLGEARQILYEDWPVRRRLNELLLHAAFERLEDKRTLEWLYEMGPSAIIDMSEPVEITDEERAAIRRKLDEAKEKVRNWGLQDRVHGYWRCEERPR